MVIYNTAFLLLSCRWSQVEPVETAPDVHRRCLHRPVESAGGAGGIFSGTAKIGAMVPAYFSMTAPTNLRILHVPIFIVFIALGNLYTKYYSTNTAYKSIT